MEDFEAGNELLQREISPTISVKEAHQNSIESIAAHPEGKEVATGSHDHLIKIWEVETGKQLLQF